MLPLQDTSVPCLRLCLPVLRRMFHRMFRRRRRRPIRSRRLLRARVKMSNPVMTPGVPPIVPPPPRRRSLAGPCVLIVLGTIFLMATMRVLSIGRLAHLFANYWPALLIVWGVIKLIEHQRAQREGYRASGIGGGGVVLVVMIVVFGLIATQIEHVNWSGLHDQFNFDDSDFSGIFGQSFNYNDNLEQDFPAGASLKVIDTHGAISVH